MRSIRHPRSTQRDLFPDLSRAMAAHPVGIGAGAVLGGVLGFVLASLFAGPAGTLAGAAIGALAGAIVGTGIAERHRRSRKIGDGSLHEANERYFAQRFEHADYRKHDETLDDYRPAYRYGMRARALRGGIWDDALERELALEWHLHRGDSKLDWDRARVGVYEAFSDEFNLNAPVNERFRVG